MKKKEFAFGIVLSMLLGVTLNFLPLTSLAQASIEDGGGKITCHSSSTNSSQNTFTQCSTCTVADGIGSDAGQCRPN